MRMSKTGECGECAVVQLSCNVVSMRVGLSLLCGDPGVERTVAQGLLNRLEREGFVSSARGRRVTRMVLKEKLAQGMERFMLRKAKAAGLEDMGQGDKREVEEKASGPPLHLALTGQ